MPVVKITEKVVEGYRNGFYEKSNGNITNTNNEKLKNKANYG